MHIDCNIRVSDGKKRPNSIYPSKGLNLEFYNKDPLESPDVPEVGNKPRLFGPGDVER